MIRTYCDNCGDRCYPSKENTADMYFEDRVYHLRLKINFYLPLEDIKKDLCGNCKHKILTNFISFFKTGGDYRALKRTKIYSSVEAPVYVDGIVCCPTCKNSLTLHRPKDQVEINQLICLNETCGGHKFRYERPTIQLKRIE